MSGASLANLLADEDPELAIKVVEIAPYITSNSHRLGAWVYKTLEARVFMVVHCMPADLRSLSPRDPTTQNPKWVQEKASRRLTWILAQSSGKFLRTILSSKTESSQALGVDAERGVIYDHEDIRVEI
jgi:hypothetical protein